MYEENLRSSRTFERQQRRERKELLTISVRWNDWKTKSRISLRLKAELEQKTTIVGLLGSVLEPNTYHIDTQLENGLTVSLLEQQLTSKTLCSSLSQILIVLEKFVFPDIVQDLSLQKQLVQETTESFVTPSNGNHTKTSTKEKNTSKRKKKKARSTKEE